ncbi:MAG: hypothetical protein E4G91_03025 [Candidatus Zixiibacteriota bacterium]|nr:MAG: hypothetical protein E4G91_03025 [candidate division Zixibacteria bacterium]
MKNFTSLVGILVLFIGSVLPPVNSFGADKATEKAEKVAFIDLDGDGFDDNATPEDQNSTINKPKTDAAGKLSDTTSASTGFFDFGSTLTPKSQLFLNNSSAFASAKQRVVSGLQHRGGFGSGSDFGAGNDVGSGAVIGGVCVGGVCH